jgi:Tol biopolymer transport system component
MAVLFRWLVIVAAVCSLLELPAVLARQAAPTPGPARYYNPHFSSDGTKVIFESTRDGKYTIYSINLDGSGLRKLTDSRQDDAQPHWSPDGTLITFTRQVVGVSKVFVMDADGRNARQVSTGPRNDAAPAFSRDGKYVAWAASSARPEDWREIGVAAVDGTGERLITSGPGNDQAPVWISNIRLVYVTEFPPKSDWRAMTPEDHIRRRASAELMAVDLDGSHPAQLTKNSNGDNSPSFAARMDRVFFRTDRGGADELWSMKPDGTDPKHEDASLSGGAIAADGRMLAYSKIVGDRSGIYVRAVGGTLERELVGGERPSRQAIGVPLAARGSTHHQSTPERMFWLWWKTLSGSYVVFTSTSRL